MQIGKYRNEMKEKIRTKLENRMTEERRKLEESVCKLEQKLGEIEKKGGELVRGNREAIKRVRSRIIAIQEKLLRKGREERRRNIIIEGVDPREERKERVVKRLWKRWMKRGKQRV